jgi:hypothetical protein
MRYSEAEPSGVKEDGVGGVPRVLVCDSACNRWRNSSQVYKSRRPFDCRELSKITKRKNTTYDIEEILDVGLLILSTEPIVEMTRSAVNCISLK